jgi:hypothetical protein
MKKVIPLALKLIIMQRLGSKREKTCDANSFAFRT